MKMTKGTHLFLAIIQVEVTPPLTKKSLDRQLKNRCIPFNPPFTLPEWGYSLFPLLSLQRVESSYSVKPIGEIEEVTQKFYAISAERKLRHPAVAAICDYARRSIFDEGLFVI